MRRYEIHVTAEPADASTDNVTIEVREVGEDQHWTEAGFTTVRADARADLADVVAGELRNLGLT